ncbi:MAG: bifunctional transaldolase/phosoglucose isomerase [Chloroflexi bacterium]|nr:bifunctional transaldolase/phosoglucose isomerase [Chloroflexota bacterium]
MTHPLLQLQSLGQSPWHDNIRRGLLVNGDLKRMVKDGDITGLTSNPTIFEQAIANSNDYDEALRELALKGKNAEEIFDALSIDDIREAADVFAPVYKRTQGLDGYVSIEVSPKYARSTEKTSAEAKRLWKAVNRPNLMIKIPATKEGLPAVEQCISQGINVNVTLIFSLERYYDVTIAHINGLAKRAAKKKRVDNVASVASFFVSRLDTLIDGMFDKKITADPLMKKSLEPLMGKAAIANAKLAYKIFQERYEGKAFAELAASGAQAQRVLWASTSTKNPKYVDTIYVDNLIGPHTVNTMPPATIKVFKDHGKAEITLTQNVQEASDFMDTLAEAGVNMTEVTQKLEDDGVAAFFKSFDSLLKVIEVRRQAEIVNARTSLSLTAEQRKLYEAALARVDGEKIPTRLWAKDSTIWKPTELSHQNEIKIRMGWLTVISDMRNEIPNLQPHSASLRGQSSLISDLKKEKFTHALILGMGGSSLAPEVFRETFGVAKGGMDVGVLDSTDPASVQAALKRSKPEKTLYIVSSKSGGTIEVMSFFKFFYEKVKAVKGEKAGENFIAITDPDTSLEKLAKEKSFRRVFLNPPDIGGRYSALSLFGLVPAALLGIDVGKLLDRASEMSIASSGSAAAARNAGAMLGALMGALGRDKVTLITSDKISSFGYWVEQLIAESTGKEGRSIVPIEGEPLGEAKAYGKDRLFVYLRLNKKYDALVEKLRRAKHPVMQIDLRDAYDLGAEFLRWEIATAIASWFIKVNPFDQPNVQEAKDITQKILGDAANGIPPAEPSVPVDRRDFQTRLNLHLKQIKKGDYVALNAFITRTPKTEKALKAIRQTIRDKHKVATTVGYGPRFLHSTGQLHKGGGDNIVVIQFTAPPLADAAIPDETFSFGNLIAAQALGDFQSLKSRGRRILRVELSEKYENDLAKIALILAGKKTRR